MNVFPQHPSVKTRFFVQILPCGKNHSLQKSRKLGEVCRVFLCEPKMNIHTLLPLWKTPVENPVENVENCDLSTGIPPLSNSGPSCGKVCIHPCISSTKIMEIPCYVTTGTRPPSVQSLRKSLQIVKFRCHFLFPFRSVGKIFVKNRQITFPVSSS